jgi:undecaprenyl diphosphate synthase
MAKGSQGESSAEAQGLKLNKLPRHVAFIMDGNGRWARRHGFVRVRGHREGAEALRRVTRYCRSLGIKEVTFFALSTENFARRPAREVRFLLGLLKRYLIEERAELLENNIQLRTIGHIEAFPGDVQTALEETERLTALETGMVMRLALNYGARREILDAVGNILRAVSSGELSPQRAQALAEADFRRYLHDPEMSDPDLLIRTGGESRLSNFLLWQSSYTEIWVTPLLWPDFDVEGVREALRAFDARVRKYGALGPPARYEGLEASRLASGASEKQARRSVAGGE